MPLKKRLKSETKEKRKKISGKVTYSAKTVRGNTVADSRAFRKSRACKSDVEWWYQVYIRLCVTGHRPSDILGNSLLLPLSPSRPSFARFLPLSPTLSFFSLSFYFSSPFASLGHSFGLRRPQRETEARFAPLDISLSSLSLSLSLVHPERRLFSSLPLLDASCIVPLARRGSCAPRHPLRLPSNSPGHNPRDILPFRTRLTRKITERGSILSCRCLLTEGFNRRNRGISKF